MKPKLDENDSAVMSVELFDREWKRLPPAPDTEYRWRGVSMDRYEKGRWRRPHMPVNGYNLSIGDRWVGSPIIRQVIKLEPNLAEAYYQLGLAYRRLKRPAEAQQTLAVFKRLSDSQKEQEQNERREIVRRLADVRF